MMAVLLGATNLYGVSRLMANLRRGGGFIGVLWGFMGGIGFKWAASRECEAGRICKADEGYK